jgi:hypothetical protein
MSHFAVLLIGNDIEEQLSKYDENLEIPRYILYTKEELIANERESIEEYKNDTYAEYLSDPIKYAENTTNENHLKYLKEEFPKKLTMTDEEIYELAIKWYDPEDIGENGEVYSTRNPNSKWDWYEVGGRWGGTIAVKDGVEIDMPNFSWGWDADSREKVIAEGTKTDSAYVRDIDFSKMHRTEEDYNEALRYWELIIEGAEPKNEDEKNQVKWNWYKPEYYTERYKNKETYAKCNSSFSMWAVVKDGEWYEKGKMGFWAMSDETHDEAVDWEMNFFDRFLKDLPEDTLITVVDCHI